jgi:site-specific DNA recombinase
MTELLPAASYARVSTKRQAEAGTSLEEQEKGIEAAALRTGHRIMARYVDGGVSGRSDRRQGFQKLIADCCSKSRPYKAVIIYNFSRFFRDDFELEGYRRKLEKAGVELISATQEISSGPQAKLQRAIITAMDSAASDINAAQVTQMMRANAEAGFWNGSVPPLGYETYVVEKRGKKEKKKLRIVPKEASQVIEIVDQFLGKRDGVRPGIAKLAQDLNSRGLSYRGRPFTPKLVYEILTRETYLGRHYYNVQDSRTRKIRPRDEWIAVPVPAIITEKDFQAVQKLLKSRDPKMSAARTHSSPVLLSGLGRCGNPGCNGTMMLMTAKSGQYRYYACSNVRRKLDRSCGGNNVTMQLVDDAVLEALEKRLLKPERLNLLLAGLLERSEGADTKRRQALGILKADRTGVETSITRLFEMVESGIIEAGDSDFKDRLATHQKRRTALEEEIRILELQVGNKNRRIDESIVATFAESLKKTLRDPSNPIMRKNYVRAFVGEVVMTKKRVIIRGPISALSDAVSSENSDEIPVRTSMVDWCTRQNSNL